LIKTAHKHNKSATTEKLTVVCYFSFLTEIFHLLQEAGYIKLYKTYKGKERKRLF